MNGPIHVTYLRKKLHIIYIDQTGQPGVGPNGPIYKKKSGAYWKEKIKSWLLNYYNSHADHCTYLHGHALMFLCF